MKFANMTGRPRFCRFGLDSDRTGPLKSVDSCCALIRFNRFHSISFSLRCFYSGFVSFRSVPYRSTYFRFGSGQIGSDHGSLFFIVFFSFYSRSSFWSVAVNMYRFALFRFVLFYFVYFHFV